MPQVIGHEVDAKGDHYLTLDDGDLLTGKAPSVLKVTARQVEEAGLVNPGWGQVLALAGGTETLGVTPKPKGKTRSG